MADELSASIANEVQPSRSSAIVGEWPFRLVRELGRRRHPNLEEAKEDGSDDIVRRGTVGGVRVQVVGAHVVSWPKNPFAGTVFGTT